MCCIYSFPVVCSPGLKSCAAALYYHSSAWYMLNLKHYQAQQEGDVEHIVHAKRHAYFGAQRHNHPLMDKKKRYTDCSRKNNNKGIKPVVAFFFFFFLALSACADAIFSMGEEGDLYFTSINCSGLNVPGPLVGFIIFSAKLSCQ